MGITLNYDEVLALAGGSVGRPHIAAALMKKGIVTSFKEAFARFLGPNGRAYVPKKKMSLEKAVSLLLAEGATPAIAHPFLLNLNGRALERLMAEYKQLGVDAIEAHYTEHSDAQTREYLALAAKLDLGVTGGSDFHGAAKPDIRLGVGKGGLVGPDAVLAALLARRKARGETF
jgi:predicted metal-dependent phosphoesterase TrpH